MLPFKYTNDGLITDNVEKALGIVRDKGVAVLTSRLSDEECFALNDQMWEALEETSHGEIKQDDQESYSKITRLLSTKHGGLIQNYMGHAQYIWDVRSNPKVMEFYRKLYKCKAEDLLVSFDGVTIGIAHLGTGDHGLYKGNNWLHLDQAPSNSKFQCVQSWVTTNNVRPGDATLRCLLGSHKYHANFAQTFRLRHKTNDWFKLTDNQVAWFKHFRKCEDVCITCPAGSQVLWDSRLVHSGIESLPLETHPSGVLNTRNVIYVCYQPRPPMETPERDRVLGWRREIFNPKNEDKYLRMTSHWPLKGRLFPRYPKFLPKHQKHPKTLKPKQMSLLAKHVAGLT